MSIAQLVLLSGSMGAAVAFIRSLAWSGREPPRPPPDLSEDETARVRRMSTVAEIVVRVALADGEISDAEWTAIADALPDDARATLAHVSERCRGVTYLKRAETRHAGYRETSAPMRVDVSALVLDVIGLAQGLDADGRAAVRTAAVAVLDAGASDRDRSDLTVLRIALLGALT